MINLTESLAEFFKILGDTTRLEILSFLNDGKERNATEIQESLQKGQSNISQQLKLLVNADLLEVRKESRNKMFRIKYPQILKLIFMAKEFISNRAKEELKKSMNQLSDIDKSDILYW